MDDAFSAQPLPAARGGALSRPTTQRLPAYYKRPASTPCMSPCEQCPAWISTSWILTSRTHTCMDMFMSHYSCVTKPQASHVTSKLHAWHVMPDKASCHASRYGPCMLLPRLCVIIPAQAAHRRKPRQHLQRDGDVSWERWTRPFYFSLAYIYIAPLRNACI